MLFVDFWQNNLLTINNVLFEHFRFQEPLFQSSMSHDLSDINKLLLKKHFLLL